MPTGYTASIKDDTTLEAFALTCARAFGALMSMRDEPSDATIPDEFPISDYFQERVDRSRAELARLESMTTKDIQDAIAAENMKNTRYRAEVRLDRAATRRRYERMLALVQRWEVPTAEHEGLKKFMIEQIEESIGFDCPAPTVDSEDRYYPIASVMETERWLEERTSDAREEIGRAAKSLAEEQARCEGRGRWVRALRASLKETR